MKAYSWDEWENMSAVEKAEIMRTRVEGFTLQPSWTNDPVKVYSRADKGEPGYWPRKPVFKPLGTEFDLKFLKDCGIATEGI
jgi:hypothetical protein